MKPALVIIGLGNPGASYNRTRHNVGYQALDVLAEEFGEGEWQDKQKFQAEIMEGRIVTVPILLVKPKTYVNLSGESVRKVVDFYKLDPAAQVLVLCDDIDLPLGDLRLKMSGGPGTHNGLKSIVEHMGEGYPRLRIGLGAQPAGADLAAWVLSTPSKEEATILAEATGKVLAMVREFVLGM